VKSRHNSTPPTSGIVCVTRENQAAAWLNFEAGALAKAVDLSRVIPLAIDLKPSDVQLPLGQFQAQPATAEGLRAVVASLNDALGERRLPDDLLVSALEVWWPRLASQLTTIEQQTSTTAPPVRTERELLEETLNTVRSLARSVDDVAFGRDVTARFASPARALSYPDPADYAIHAEMAQHAAYIRSYAPQNEAEDAVREIKKLSPLALAIFARAAGREAEGRRTFTASPQQSAVPAVAAELERNGLFAFERWAEAGSLTPKGRATARVLPIGKEGPKPEWWDEVIAGLCVPAAEHNGGSF